MEVDQKVKGTKLRHMDSGKFLVAATVTNTILGQNNF
jgi:hypothetical protein